MDDLMKNLETLQLPYLPSDSLKKIKGFKDFY
jgi:hypothetical protein